MSTLPKLQAADVSGKRVLVRVDADVPLTNSGNIEDDARLFGGMPTIEFLLKNGAKVTVIGHLGRPEGESHEERSRKRELSLAPIAKWYEARLKIKDLRPASPAGRLKTEEAKLGEFVGWKLADKLFILENLRFYPEEEENDLEFAKKLAALADIYVNDAFAVSHRSHASVVALAKLLPHYAGLRLQEEVDALTAILEHPKRPLVVVLGGAKIETKLPLVEKMHHFADFVLIGGKIAKETKTLLKVQHEKAAPLPNGHKSVLLVADLQEDGLDITKQSTENFLQVISTAATVVWNGPVGKVEVEAGREGSKLLAKGITESTAYKVVGGGDTLDFLRSTNLVAKFDFASTGGGAMLSFLSGEPLPGLSALAT